MTLEEQVRTLRSEVLALELQDIERRYQHLEDLNIFDRRQTMRPEPLPGEDRYGGTDSIEEPEEGDYVSSDSGVTWYQYGKKVLTLTDWPLSKTAEALLRKHADANSFWPNAWLISDHGNAHPFKYHI